MTNQSSQKHCIGKCTKVKSKVKKCNCCVRKCNHLEVRKKVMERSHALSVTGWALRQCGGVYHCPLPSKSQTSQSCNDRAMHWPNILKKLSIFLVRVAVYINKVRPPKYVSWKLEIVVLLFSGYSKCLLIPTQLWIQSQMICIRVTLLYKWSNVLGSFSILATACNLLQTQSPVEDPQRHTRLVEDWDGLETFSVGMRSMPHAPPPYTP